MGGLAVSDDDPCSNDGRFGGLSGTGIGSTSVPVDASPIVRVSTGEFESPFDTINSTRPPIAPRSAPSNEYKEGETRTLLHKALHGSG